MEFLITGASHGLGEELAKQLLDKNHIVTNLDLMEPSKEFKEKRNYIWLKADTRDYDYLKEISYDLNPDIIINNASVNYISYIENMDLELVSDVTNTNIMGYLNTVKAFLPTLMNKEGTILNITSRASKQPMTASLAYNMTKSAQLMMTRQMAREFSRENYGITVFAVSPGKIKDTQMSRYVDAVVPEVRGWSKKKAENYWGEKSIMPHEIDKKDLAKQIIDLLESNHEHLTGCNLEMGIE